MMTVKRLVRTLGVAAVASIALVGCRAEEQGRIIKYEPGVYKGKADTQLSKADIAALRERTLRQSGVTAASGGGAPGPKPGNDVRPPQSASELTSRARLQGGK